MAHERNDDYENQDDGEYHFSDDQINYEAEPVKAAAPVSPLVLYKKPAIGLVTFFVLIFLVYKILAPTGPATPVAEFSGGNAKPMTSKPPVAKTEMAKDTTMEAKPAVEAAKESDNAKPATQTAMAAEPASIPVAPQAQMTVTAASTDASATTEPANTAAAAAIPAASAAINIPAADNTTSAIPSTSVAPATIPAAASSAVMPASTPVTTITATSTATMPASAIPGAMPSSTVPASADVATRLAVLEEQNAKMQAEYMEKTAEMKAQSSVMQGKLQELSLHLASIETSLTRLSQNVRDMKVQRKSSAASSSGSSSMATAGEMGGEERVATPAAPRSGAKMMYSVQAIIPGRAWLKSEAGDTVTVAEGDVLKDFGRVMKIDPYDGLVVVDMGGKNVSLSYGVGAE